VRCPVRPPLFGASDQRLMPQIFAAHSIAAAFCPCGHAHGRCV